MHIARAAVAVLATGIMLSACSPASQTVSLDVVSDATVEDLGPGDTTLVEASPHDLWELETGAELQSTETATIDLGPEPGEPGYPCQDDSACNSGFCIQTPDGQQCTMLCDQECPFGWLCVPHQPSLPDEVYICAPTFMNLCKPCQTNADCRTNGAYLGDTCVPYGGAGNFCGGSCTEGNCPPTYACQEREDIAGGLSNQCVPEEAECECVEWFIDEGAMTDCFVENQWGICHGERKCLAAGLTECTAAEPVLETCNLVDDDCDGATDEDTGGTECSIQNEFGTCTGLEECDAGELQCVGDEAKPEACDGMDNNCDDEVDEDYPDTDGDGLADCLETDKDDDGIPDVEDNCEYVQNPLQEDFDVDGQGDACDLDDDNDLAVDEEDCAPFEPAVHPGAQEICNGEDDNCDGAADEGFPDLDNDGLADCVDEDLDDDGMKNPLDNCEYDFNPQQFDLDEDGEGDLCDDDDDGDGAPDATDNCPTQSNGGQEDLDGDGKGDVCDDDDDGDGAPDNADNCPMTANPGQEDLDLDGKGDACENDTDGDTVPDPDDNCPLIPNLDQVDCDQDGAGAACDDDDDGDGAGDAEDNCPCLANPDQADLDNDGLGDDCDGDLDGDGLANGLDNCQVTFNPAQFDLDGDGEGDECDDDIDGDGAQNDADNCPLLANEEQADLDQDGFGNACDKDDDGDLDPDVTDCAPLDNTIHHEAEEACDGIDNNCQAGPDEGFPDADFDGEKDCVDEDIDGDGALNSGDCQPFNPAVHPEATEVCNGTDDNCNEEVDEGQGTLHCGKGVCEHDVPACENGAVQFCNPFEGGGPELCDELDNDCDGETDEDFVLGDPCEAGVGECLATGELVCSEDGTKAVCDAVEGESQPETCDELDNDCDGVVDNDPVDCTVFFVDEDQDGIGGDDSACLCVAAAPYLVEEGGDCDDSDQLLITACALLGDGSDGEMEVGLGETFDLNVDMSGDRQHPDGVAWKVAGGAADDALTLESTLGLAPSDLALLVNLQGPSEHVGTWEVVEISAIDDATVTLSSPVVGTYPADDLVVLQRIPQYDTLWISGVLTAAAFDGMEGDPGSGRHTGIVAVRVKDKLTVGAGGLVDASQRGFRGGVTGAGPEGPTGIAGTGGEEGPLGQWDHGGAGGGIAGAASGGNGAASCCCAGGTGGLGGGGGGGKITHCAGGNPPTGGGGGGGGAAYDGGDNATPADFAKLFPGGGASAGAGGGKSGANAGSGETTAPGGTPAGGAGGEAGGGIVLLWAGELELSGHVTSAGGGGGQGDTGESRDGAGHDDGGGGGGEGGQAAAGGSILLATLELTIDATTVATPAGTGGNGGNGGDGWAGGHGTGGAGAPPGGLPTSGTNGIYQNDGGASGGGGAGGEAGTDGAIRIVAAQVNGFDFGQIEAEAAVNFGTNGTFDSLAEWIP